MHAYTHTHTHIGPTRMCSRMKIFDILSEFATFALYAGYIRLVFVSVGNKFGTFASHSPPAYEYQPF